MERCTGLCNITDPITRDGSVAARRVVVPCQQALNATHGRARLAPARTTSCKGDGSVLAWQRILAVIIPSRPKERCLRPTMPFCNFASHKFREETMTPNQYALLGTLQGDQQKRTLHGNRERAKGLKKNASSGVYLSPM
ncbi:hypothetical protein VTG60DRAFT_2361 [Thermothelomyces hinnuleus]